MPATAAWLVEWAVATDDEVMATVGRRLRHARLAVGLTQEEAAVAAGVDWRRWQRLEEGRLNLTLRTLNRAARAVRIELWTLFAPGQH